MTKKKKVAILQSNYIPWKGYFDMIASVDEFILFDDMQFTKNDWRNRNKIKTQNNLLWLTIPVKFSKRFGQKICETEISDIRWADKHWKTIQTYYGKAKHFSEVGSMLHSLYNDAKKFNKLSQINYFFIHEIARLLGIDTKISFSMDYKLGRGRNENLIELLNQAKADLYLSGPSAAEYIDEEVFKKNGIQLQWMSYTGYPEYKQVNQPFEHSVSIIDLLLCVGIKDARKYMLSFG